MSAALHHRLVGLEPDNLLAFLTLLGLLRSLDTARPEWSARAYWDAQIQPLRPVLVLADAQIEAEIVAGAAEGVGTLAALHRFDRDDLNYPADQARKLLGAEQRTPSR